MKTVANRRISLAPHAGPNARVRRRGLLAGIALLAIVGSSAVPARAQYPAYMIRDEVMKRQVTSMEQCRLVLQAAEQYAAEHGSYPEHVAALVEDLPGGLLLRNAYSFERTEPVDGAAAIDGEIGYQVIERDGLRAGCEVSCAGFNGYLILSLRSGFGTWWLDARMPAPLSERARPAAKSADESR